MSRESYIRGFCKAAEAAGIDPEELAKFAQSTPKPLNKVNPPPKVTADEIINAANKAGWKFDSKSGWTQPPKVTANDVINSAHAAGWKHNPATGWQPPRVTANDVVAVAGRYGWKPKGLRSVSPIGSREQGELNVQSL